MKVINLGEIESKELVPGYTVKFIHTENVTLAFWEVKAGCRLPLHSHIHEQVSQVTEGEFELTVEEETFTLIPEKIVVIPPKAKHTGIAISDCKITDTFYPVREDYK